MNVIYLIAAFALFSVVCYLAFEPLESLLVYNKPLKKADVIVVLAGSANERLPPIIKLFKEGVAPLILLANDGILGRWSEQFEKNLYHVEWAEQSLIRAGVPETAIIKLPFSRSGTFYDVLHTIDYVLSNNIKSIIIATSDYHTKRAYWIFRQLVKQEGIEIGTYPISPYSTVRGSNLYTYRRFKQLSVEFIKLIYYQVKYGF